MCKKFVTQDIETKQQNFFIALKRNRESNEYIISEIEEMVNKLENKIIMEKDGPSKEYRLNGINELRTKINRIKNYN